MSSEKKRNQNERRLQRYVFRHLRGLKGSGKNVIRMDRPYPEIWQAWAVYQGEDHHTEEDGFWLREMGVTAGVHDVHFMYYAPHIGTGFATIELKWGKNDMSDHQKNFAYKMGECKHLTGKCYSVKQVQQLIKSWGFKCVNETCIEPPRSIEEQRKAVHNFYGRPNTHVKTVAEVRQEAQEE